MPRYFLHLRDGTDVALDEEGTVHSNLDALRQAVREAACDCIAGDVTSRATVDLRFRIDAEDEGGAVVYSLPFDQAVTVVTE